jgi:acyl-coenzyme A synthetase/AMP-(fatty) acid ligase/3-hydroxymyristoyl/3-hydroxydecanoyl-(acyl carrier protein) dehydratase
MTSFPAHASTDPVAIGPDGLRTFADLRAAASAIAARLSALPGRRVVLACDDRYHFTAGLLGAWAAQREVVLPPSTQPAVLATLTGAGDVILLHDRPDHRGEGHDLAAWLDAPPAGDPGALSLPAPDREVVWIATSGSTGASQWFAKTLGQLVAEVSVHARLFEIGRGARFLVTAPPHHIYGLLWGVLLPLRAGATILRRTALQPEAVADAVTRLGATHVVSVPAHLAALASAGPLPPVTRVFSSSAPLPAATAQALAAAGWTVTEIFGSSETGGIGWRDRTGTPWSVFPGLRVGVGEAGLLEVDGPFLHPAQPRPFVTGDRAREVPGGFEVLGRADGVVKAGGKRVTLAEIEERARAVAGVTDAAALCQEVGGARGQEIWLAVAGAGVRPEAVRAELARWLDPLVLPRRLRVLPALPRRETGKLPRAELEALFVAPSAAAGLAPVITRRTPLDEGGEELTLRIPVPADLAWFEGHFTGRAVLPGVVQVQEIVVREARRAWPALGQPRSLEQLKFKRIISPGDEITAVLRHRRPARRVDFTLATARGGCASGTVIFDAAPGGSTP